MKEYLDFIGVIITMVLAILGGFIIGQYTANKPESLLIELPNNTYVACVVDDSKIDCDWDGASQ